MSRTSAIVIAIVTHAWRLRLWLRSSFLDGDRDCDCDWKSCDYDCDCDCDSLCFSWLCAHWNTDCDCDLNGDCDPLETRIFFDYDFGDSTTGSSSVITATSFFRALILSLIAPLSARRANFFSAVRKILDLVSVFWEAKKWAQNRNWNEIFPCIEDIAT